MDSDGISRSARVSHDLRYRYSLERRWDIRGASGDGVLWVMLNPSTADARQDDPTIRRCVSFSRGFGFASLHVVNLYAFRTTDPKRLDSPDDPIGPENDAVIAIMAKEAQAIIVAWGANPRFGSRARDVLGILRSNAQYAQRLHCLGRTKAGCPRHPLYVRSDTELQVYHG